MRTGKDLNQSKQPALKPSHLVKEATPFSPTKHDLLQQKTLETNKEKDCDYICHLKWSCLLQIS